MRFSKTLMTNGVPRPVGVEGPQREQVDGETGEADGEATERPRRVQRIGCREVAMLQREADDRAAQREHQQTGREREQGDETDPERRDVDHPLTQLAFDVAGHLRLDVVAIDIANRPWGSTNRM